MEIPGYEDTFFDNIPEDIKQEFYKGKQRFEQKKQENIARNEETARKSRINTERAQFISHCIKLRDNMVNMGHQDTSDIDYVSSVDK